MTAPLLPRTSVGSDLMALLRASLAATQEALGSMTREPVTYVKTTIDRFDYKMSGPSSASSFQTVEREELPLNAAHDIYQHRVKALPEHQKCLDALTQHYGEQRSTFALQQFVAMAIGRSLSSQDFSPSVDDVCALIADLENTPIDWHAIVWLDGIWLDCEEIRLSRGEILRRPKSHDLEEERRADFAMIGMPSGGLTGSSIPSAILEFTSHAATPFQVQKRLDKMLDALRLFRLGAVRYTTYTVRGHTFLRMSGVVIGSGLISGPDKYQLTSSESSLLVPFLERIEQQIPEDPSSGAPIDPVAVALQRYREALMATGPVEGRIALAMSCMEALFLKAEERSELTHRLSQRAAALLANAGVHPLKSYRELARAYGIRSTFIHGSALKSEEYASADELRRTVLDYARMSLVIFLQTEDASAKDAFLSRIDNSMLDDAARQKLTSQLASTAIRLAGPTSP